MADTRSTIKALITKVKSPKVKILMGKVKINKMGRTTALTTPKTKATKRTVQKPLTLTPGISQALMKIATALISQVINNFI